MDEHRRAADERVVRYDEHGVFVLISNGVYRPLVRVDTNTKLMPDGAEVTETVRWTGESLGPLYQPVPGESRHDVEELVKVVLIPRTIFALVGQETWVCHGSYTNPGAFTDSRDPRRKQGEGKPAMTAEVCRT